jgi:nitrite reductase/ring-hydroxylating ferredoxin subunit
LRHGENPFKVAHIGHDDTHSTGHACMWVVCRFHAGDYDMRTSGLTTIFRFIFTRSNIS